MFDHETESYFCPRCDNSLGGQHVPPDETIECPCCHAVTTLPLVFQW